MIRMIKKSMNFGYENTKQKSNLGYGKNHEHSKQMTNL